MRKQLLLSTGIVCLMLAPGLSYGQAPTGRSEEPKQMQPSGAGKGAASQERGTERAQERAKGGEQKAQGAMGREERGTGSRQAGEKGKAAAPGADRPTAASDDSKRGRGEDARPAARAQDSRQGGREGKDAKGSAEMKRDGAGGKSSVESEKTRDGTAASQKEREGTATTQKEPSRDQRGETSRGSAEQSKDRPAAASETTRTQTQTSQTQSQQSGISTDRQVRISETLTRERLAPPQRNLNVAIRVGERIPRNVRVQRLPAAIVAIEPAYRGYDYFTTEEEIVIIEPGTQRIVSHVPRDASRIRAAGGETGSGRAADAMAQAGGAPCRIMRRDTAGNITEVSPTTVGSTAPQESISVTVRAPGGGGSTNPIALGASDGQIVVAMQGGDCTVTIEPQPR